VPTTSEPNKSANEFDKKPMEESIIEELSKKFEAVLLANMARNKQETVITLNGVEPIT
jgi:hypothetical protein